MPPERVTIKLPGAAMQALQTDAKGTLYSPPQFETWLCVCRPTDSTRRGQKCPDCGRVVC